MLIFFLFLNANICCGYSLEAPRRGASNEYNNIGFCGEMRKIFTWYPVSSRDMRNQTTRGEIELANEETERKLELSGKPDPG